MDTRNPRGSNRLATGIRAATMVVVIGTLAAIWHPSHHDAAPAATGTAAANVAPSPQTAAPYFPDRFPAPQGPVEALPPQF